jgi:2,3-bisphosphoglycerate-dependent phosphoglycerate mutase
MARRRRASKIEIVFESHSTSVDNERWIASGWLDPQLSPLGRRQAKELGERHVEDEVVVVFCSDLARASETAQVAFGGRGLPIFKDWRLRECNYGMLNGTAVARLEVERTKHVLDPYPGGESYLDVVARARSFLHDLPPRYPDERIVVIGHSATKWAFDHLLEGAPLDELVEGSFRWQPGWLYTLTLDA